MIKRSGGRYRCHTMRQRCTKRWQEPYAENGSEVGDESGAGVKLESRVENQNSSLDRPSTIE